SAGPPSLPGSSLCGGNWPPRERRRAEMLTLTNITKTFNPGTLNEKKALRGIDLHLDAGDFAAIVGSNGAGKSTLFNAIAGNFFTDTGRIELDGRDITFEKDF